MPPRKNTAPAPQRSAPINEVVVRPGVGMLALFPAMNYKAWYAIGEFVDNALQSWNANKDLILRTFGSARLDIDVSFDAKAQTITVSDNAAGIFTADIARAFTPASPPADTSGLSQFGIGMKSAAAWYAERFSVTTTALGETVRRSVDFDIPAIVDSGASSIPLSEVPEDPLAHGTDLVLSNLNHPVPKGRTLGKVRDYLRSIYRGFIQDSDIRITIGGQRLTYTPPDLLRAPRWDDLNGPEQRWYKPIDLTLGSGARVTGWAGILAKGAAKQAGFAMLYRGKVVKGAGGGAGDLEDGYKPAEIFKAANSFESQRIVGELTVVGVPVTHTKDALLWVGDDEERLIELLAEELDSEPLPLLRMARGHRATERGRTAQAHVSKALDMIGKDLELELPESPAPPEPAPAAPRTELAEPVERLVRYDGLNLRLRVIDEPSIRTWVSLVRDGDGVWLVEINRSHPFMQAFASVPNMDIEPVLRLAVGFALVQIRMTRSGAVEPSLILPSINDLVSSHLSRRIDL